MTLGVLLRKDLRREWRGREGLFAGLVLVALFEALFAWTFLDLRDDPRAAVAVLWIPLLFGAAAIAGRGLADEAAAGTLERLRSLPIPMVWHGVSRTLVDGLVIAGVGALHFVLASLLFGIPITLELATILGLGVIGLTLIATLAGGLAAQARAREVLLPILVVPAAAPLLVAGTRASLVAVGRDGWSEIQAPLLLMAGYDIAAAGIAWLLWPILLEDE